MALSQYYVDPTIAGNSGTGTIGDPYGDLQYALNTLTRDTTNGDQINIKAGTAEALTAALSLATYGTPTAAAPLMLRGYTTAADDGGVGVISGAGSYAILSGDNDHIALIDLRLTNVGANYVASFRNFCSAINCEIDTGTAGGLVISGASLVAGCYVHDVAAHGLYCSGSPSIVGNRFAACGGAATYAISLESPGGKAIGNVIQVPTGANGIYCNNPFLMVLSNTIVGSSGTKTGINVAAYASIYIVNNVVVGFSGSGGKGIAFDAGSVVIMYHSNAYYNNATNVSGTPKTTGYAGNNDALGGDPFVDASGGDFDINGTVAGVTEDAWPQAFQGLASTAPKPDKGAVQAGAGAGTIGVFRRVMRLIGG